MRWTRMGFRWFSDMRGVVWWNLRSGRDCELFFCGRRSSVVGVAVAAGGYRRGGAGGRTTPQRRVGTFSEMRSSNYAPTPRPQDRRPPTVQKNEFAHMLLTYQLHDSLGPPTLRRSHPSIIMPRGRPPRRPSAAAASPSSGRGAAPTRCRPRSCRWYRA